MEAKQNGGCQGREQEKERVKVYWLQSFSLGRGKEFWRQMMVKVGRSDDVLDAAYKWLKR